ncbi:MAG: saccharopine dehydrogenase NADP-binding domain-containing protein [Flavobacteriales bacterium]|nr:saccharopine dehydrogenase NADP-binding domain-containing protein [Flavobacteriales bacterium]
MKKILVVGSGRSASSLLKYLKDGAEENKWLITIMDQNQDLLDPAILESNNVTFAVSDINNVEKRRELIKGSDIVISMLPARMHPIVAKDCILFRKNMVTASYVSDEMRSLQEDAKAVGVILMNEMGVDPGIDHMSAMRVIDAIQSNGGKMIGFESFTGGLVAPESDNNPWHYKFTWNPRNVVIAGQGSTVKFIQEGTYKYIPYHKLFRRTEIVEIDGYGRFEGYANRDSLKYRSLYGLDDVKTIYRGTFRRPGFCRAWNVFVQLGATDDSYVLEGSEHMTHRDFINSFLAFNPNDSVELKLMHYLHIDQDSDLMEKLEWLGIFSNEKVGLKDATPAQILQKICEKKWSLDPEDKDMIVMWHKFDFERDGKKEHKESSMVVIGDDQRYTAMAKTVGLPVAIGAKMILNGKIKTPGVHIPVSSEIYTPVLDELEAFGIRFIEK